MKPFRIFIIYLDRQIQVTASQDSCENIGHSERSHGLWQGSGYWNEGDFQREIEHW